MSDTTKKLSFLDEFPEVSSQQWREKIEADLKGADFDRKLVWRTNEGLSFQPYYRQEDVDKLTYLDALPGSFPYTRSAKTKDFGWGVKQDVILSSVADTNKKIITAIQKGATSIGIVTNGKLSSVSDIEALLNGILLDEVSIAFVTGKDGISVSSLFQDYCSSKGIDPQSSITIDPIGSLTLSGEFYTSQDQDIKELAEAVKKSATNCKVVGVNASVFHNAGANIIQELAYALSIGSEYLNLLGEAEVDAKTAAGKIHFTFATGTSYFMEIAKYRAARLLWGNIVKAYANTESCEAAMQIHAETSLSNKTVYDPYVNMLRVTTECMSAALGGANSITVFPFDKSFGEGNEFGERIARNTQIILKEEAYFDKVIDPSAGSYYIEELTDKIAEEAWKLFTDIESKGGFIANFVKGNIQNEIEATAAKKKLNIARRKEVLLGTNQFPNFNETIKDIQPAEKTVVDGKVAKPLSFVSLSEDFETLRLSTDKADKRPIAFMLTVGNLTWRKARATFACNFFACGGYEVIDNLGFETVADGLKAAKEANADIVVICSSDDEYEIFAPDAFKALGNDGLFVVAGAPACTEKLQQEGIEHFIHVKTNVLEKLQEMNEILGIG